MYDPFSLTAESQTKFWNYSKPESPEYSPVIEGELVEIQLVHAKDMNRNPKYFPDGNPIRNCQFVLLCADGEERIWVFSMRKSGNAMRALAATGCASLKDLLGKVLAIQTVEPPQGFSYGQQNPRPWSVVVKGDGSQPNRGAHDMIMENPTPQPQMQAPVMQQMDPRLAQAMTGAFQATQQMQGQNAMQFNQQPVQQFAQPVNQAPQQDLYDQDIPF